MTDAKRPVALIILDGFGFSETIEHNAIQAAQKPTWDSNWATSANTLIKTSGLAVGLPEGQMGNSEVGHMTLGAGRVVYQNYTRINKAISDGDFFENPTYAKAIDGAIRADKAVHIMGLLSEGGVHSHQDHIFAMVEMAVKRGAKKVYVHAFLDGRDCPPRSAKPCLAALEAKFAEVGGGRLASMVGRYYAMDRDNRWDRVETAYNVIAAGAGLHTATSGIEALAAAYERDENDEFVGATAIVDAEGKTVAMEDGDIAIFMNFRPDRARELTRTLTDTNFDGFAKQSAPKLAEFVMTTEYAGDIAASCAFPPEEMVNSFGEVLSKLGKTQLRIAETEKYAHVTFFFSGGQEAEYTGEDRILVPSPQVATYDLKPEMSAPEVTEKLVEAIKSGKYDAIICNYANCDMVGHTGDFDAAVKAVEAVDTSLAAIFEAIKAMGGDALVTADHGNVEEMFDDAVNQPHTQHTTGPVPLLYVGERKLTLNQGGSLADIAPTMLELMGVQQPTEMNGCSLIKH